MRTDAGDLSWTLKRMPDPARAHGAWVYLGLSILAGVATAAFEGPAPALFAGIGFAGAFLCASSLTLGDMTSRGRRFGRGLALTVLGFGLAFSTGATPSFVGFAVLALVPLLAAGAVARRGGPLAPEALALAVSGIVVVAPSAACAGGASVVDAALLLMLIGPFYVWRTCVVRRRIQARRGWTRRALKRCGIVEAVLATGWTAIALLVVHGLAIAGR